MGGASAPTVDAVVKWFKSDKGFGFVELGNGQGDAFLHIGALQSAGYEDGASRRQAEGPLSATAPRACRSPACSRSTRPAPPSGPLSARSATRRARSVALRIPATAVQVSGSVKWFDDNKGFGFVQSNDGGKDVFVHISILGPSGVHHLAEGQAVNMRVVDTPKGREALSITLA